jgi:hypothetical protein
MTHEGVDKAELGAIATVGQDGEKTLVGQPVPRQWYHTSKKNRK